MSSFLGIRANAKGNAYLDRHPQRDGAPFYLHKYAGRLVLKGWGGPIWRVYRQPQADSELEQLRQEAWRRGRYVMLWIFGFPAVIFGVMALLIVTGYVR